MASEMMDAFAQGVSVANALEDRYQQRKALGAAIEKYGDRARDPGLYTALQNSDIAGAQEARAERESQQSMQIRSAQEGRAAETFSINKQDNDQAKRQQATLGLVQGLRQARDRGEDVGAAFDKMAETLPSLGVNPDDIPAMRQAVVDNPAILDDYLAALSGQQVPAEKAGQQVPADKVGDKERARIIMNDPSATPADKRWATGIMGGAKAFTADTGPAADSANKVFGDIINRIDILEGKDANYVESVGGQDEFTRVQESIFGLPSLRGMRSGGFGTYGSIAGSRSADYVSNFDALSGDVRSAAFETLKGGGSITEKESEFAANAIAKLSRSTSPDEYRRELKRLRAYMTNLQDASARRQAGEDVPEQLQYPPEAAADDEAELAKRILADPNADPADRQWAESLKVVP